MVDLEAARNAANYMDFIDSDYADLLRATVSDLAAARAEIAAMRKAMQEIAGICSEYPALDIYIDQIEQIAQGGAA